MFGFLISREVTDDAVRIVHSVEQVLSDLETMSKDDFITKFAGVDADLPDQDQFAFKIRPEPDFIFHYREWKDEPSMYVTGGAKYAGFSLYARSGSYSKWHCSSQDGISYRATAGSRKMVKVLFKKFGIECFDKL